MNCPDKNSSEWKALVSRFGETGAYREYVKNNFETPTNLPRLVPERTNNVEYINSVYSELNNRIGFIPETHEYFNKNTGVKYKPVSTVKSEYGYGDNIEDSTKDAAFRDHYTLAGRTGTTIHDYLNKLLIGEKYEELDNVPMTKQARQFLNKMVKDIKRNGKVIASEQVLVDDATGIAGTMDLEILNKNNELIQLDYKTKIVDYVDANGKSTQGYRKVPFKYYTSTLNGKPDKLKHDFQQTMYKRMQELMGIDVKYKGIIPLEIVMQRNEKGVLQIYDIRYTENLPLDDKLHYYNLVSNNIITPVVNNVLGITNNIDDQVLDLSLDRLEELASKGLTLLKKRAGFLRAVGDEFNAIRLEGEIKDISPLDAATEVFSILKVANSLMKPYMKQYNDLLQEEKSLGKNGYRVWKLKTLSGWRNFAMAFDTILDDVQSLYEENPDIFNNIEGLDKNAIEPMINETINAKNSLKSAYKNKGMKQWLEWIAKDSKIIEYQFRKDFEQKYKKNWLENNPNGKFSQEDVDQMNSATDEFINNNQNAIRLETERFIKAQSDMANEDVNFIYRWADTIFDTKDPIIGNMSKIYYDKMREMRLAANDYYRRLSNIVDEFDKKYNPSSFANQQEMYDYMLDYSADGSVHIIERIPWSFKNAYNAMLIEAQDLYPEKSDRDAKSEFIQEWLQKHAPLSESADEDIREDREQLYFDELSNGNITQDEYNALMQNEDAGFKKGVTGLFKDGDITEETAFRLKPLLLEIRWNNRIPNKLLYPNVKYDNLQKMNDGEDRKSVV